jgi:hypothetical protein
MSRRHMGEWMYISTHSRPRHWFVETDQFNATVVLPPGNEAAALIEYEPGWAPKSAWKTWRRKNVVTAGTRTPTTRPSSP